MGAMYSLFHMIKYSASPSRAATLAILQLCPVANNWINIFRNPPPPPPHSQPFCPQIAD